MCPAVLMGLYSWSWYRGFHGRWHTPWGLSRGETPVTCSGIVSTFHRWLHLLQSGFIRARTLPRCIIFPLTRRSFDKIPIVREGYRTAHTELPPHVHFPIFIRPPEQMLALRAFLPVPFGFSFFSSWVQLCPWVLVFSVGVFVLPCRLW